MHSREIFKKIVNFEQLLTLTSDRLKKFEQFKGTIQTDKMLSFLIARQNRGDENTVIIL